MGTCQRAGRRWWRSRGMSEQNELKEILAAYEQTSNDLRDSLNRLPTHRGTCLITGNEPAVNFPFYTAGASSAAISLQRARETRICPGAGKPPYGATEGSRCAYPLV